MNKKIEKQMQDLVDKINQWNYEYFDLDSPSVSDRVYDSHLKMLVELEKEYPNLILKDSPTKKIGGKTKETFKKVQHKKSMLSLNKAYSIEEIEKFINDIKRIAINKQINFLIEPKIDGLSISLHYENGKLIQAITRGDGIVGEDVSKNVINIINDIPTNINYSQKLEVRGEIYITKSMFNKINQLEQTNYANPRNLASGTLRQLNNTIVKQRNLSSFIYDIVNYEDHQLKSQDEVITFLKKLGFHVFEERSVVNSLNQIQNYIQEFDKYRNDLDYETDGIVIKLNQIEFYEKIGYTSKFPKYAIAYKFDDEIVNTTLKNIFITIGRTGMVTYNAQFHPVLLKGTMVSAATLHNWNYINDLQLNIGDEICIKKAGEIIPKVVSIFKKNSIGIFNKINQCPYCQSLLVDTSTLNIQICPNKNCKEQIIKRIVHFASRDATNIEGLAEGIIRKLNDLNILNSIKDIYLLKMHKNIIVNHKGFGNKFWSNLNKNIEDSKNVSLEKLLFALGIHQLGTKNAKQIANVIKSFDSFVSVDLNKLKLVKDIGPITVNEIEKFLNDNSNIELIKFLIEIGINPKIENKYIDNNNYFYNKSIVISGTFSIPRNELIALLEKKGAIINSSISKKTNILLVGENPGSKLNKAKDFKIKILTEEQLNEFLK